MLPCLGKEPVLVLSAGIDCATSSHSCLHLQQHGFIFNSHMKKISLLIHGSTWKSWGSFGSCTTRLGCIKTLQSPKLKHPSCETASNSRRKIWLGSYRTFLLPFPIIPTGKIRNIRAKRTVMMLTPSLQVHRGCSPSTGSRQIKQCCSRLFVQHLCCANPCSTKGSGSTFYYSWGGFLTAFKYFKRWCMEG